MKTIVISKSAEETIKIGEEFGEKLKQGDVVAFYGELGSGKTTMIKGICWSLGVSKGIKSPSFVLLRVYRGKQSIYHFDFYRLREKGELKDLDYERFFYGSGIVLIEWAERIKEFLSVSHYEVRMEILSENKREIRFSRVTEED